MSAFFGSIAIVPICPCVFHTCCQFSAGIDRLEDAGAEGDIAADVGLPAPDVQHVRIRGRHRDRADRVGRLIIEHRLPVPPPVLALPHPALREGGVVGQRIAGHARHAGPRARRSPGPRPEFQGPKFTLGFFRIRRSPPRARPQQPRAHSAAASHRVERLERRRRRADGSVVIGMHRAGELRNATLMGLGPDGHRAVPRAATRHSVAAALVLAATARARARAFCRACRAPCAASDADPECAPHRRRRRSPARRR